MALTLESGAAAGHDARPSPKRKRTDSTTASAADTVFAPDLSSSSSHAIHPSATEPLRSSLSPQPPASPDLRPVHPSHSSTPLLIPLLENEDAEPFTGADSPRSAVARKLEGLDLAVRSHARPMPILSFGDARTKGGEKKKVKLDPEAGLCEDFQLDPAGVRAGSPVKASHTSTTTSPSKRAKSPPLHSGTPGSSRIGDSNIIWWSDAEITGHLGLDPDDDGYGINGIGFKPTPAMAAARSMKRRRQMDEWRSRELREERRRRAEGRRRGGSADPGGGGGGGTRGGIVKRTVRFASS